MKAVLQRVLNAAVYSEKECIAQIEKGILALVGVADTDGDDDALCIAKKIAGIRIFEDQQGKMNRSVKEVGGCVLVVSQFTLLADTGKGRRPSFTNAAPPDKAQALYAQVVAALQREHINVCTGRFASHMNVTLNNDGPVTIILDTAELLSRST